MYKFLYIVVTIMTDNMYRWICQPYMKSMIKNAAIAKNKYIDTYTDV